MEGKDNIKELFSQKLGNYEAPVNPDLWASISSQVAAAGTTTAASTGLSMLAKVAIGIGVSTAAIATVVVLSTSSEKDKKSAELPKTELQESNTESTRSETEAPAENGVSQESALTADTRINQQELEPSTESQQLETPTQLNEPDPMISNTPMDINNMSTKRIQEIETTEDEPQIIQGVTYANETNYGAEPENSEDYQLDETPSAPKEAPIKRFVNVFTPNGDKENDEFFLESEGLTDFSVVVFNPEGDIVYKSDDPNFRWDGRDIRTNEIVPEGNYMYMVTAYDAEGNPYPIYERLKIKK